MASGMRTQGIKAKEKRGGAKLCFEIATLPDWSRT